MTRRHAFHALNLAHFFDHFVLMIMPTAALAFAGDYADGVLPATWTLGAFALATLPAGWLGDRWGRVPMMRLFWFGTGAACLLTGLSHGAVGFTAGMVLIGLFAAIYHPVATAMIMGHAREAGHALAVNGVWGNLGIAAAALVTAGLAEFGSWRAAFVVPGIAMLVVGLGYLAIPATAQQAPAPERRGDDADPAAQLRVLGFIAISGLLGGLIFNGVTIVLPRFLAERMPELGLFQVGAAASLIFAVAGFAQLPVGRLLDRWDARPLLFVVEGIKLPLLVAMALAPGALAAAFALPVLLLVFGEIPITAWLLGRHLGERWWSRAYALHYLLALGVAAVTVPLIVTLHRATGGQAALILVLAVCSAATFAGAFLVPAGRRTHPCQGGPPTSALPR